MTFERFSRLASIPALAIGLFLYLTAAVQASSVSLLRDPDIENGLRQLAAPIFRAAGLNPKRVRVLVVNQSSLNAFVVDHNSVFLNYGLILRVDTPEMLQAVIAHEVAHITNGHIARRTQNFKSANSAAGLGAALALLAAAAGGGEAAAGVAIGTQSAALRGFLSHTRAEESSADQTAISLLKRAGINTQGMVDLHKLFVGQDLLSSANQDPYTRSHPLTRDRVRAAQAFVAAHGGSTPTSAEAQYWLSRVQGKLSAFTRASKWTLRRAKSEPYEDIRLMREAIAHHRSNNSKKALRAMDAAIAKRPNDGFYLELRGQILMENRKWSDALATYRRAASQQPKDSLILASLGRAQLAAGQNSAAVKTMERARSLDFRNNVLLRDMAQAYAKTGKNGMAAVVTAERYALRGRLNDAEIHAKRASGLLPRGSAAWRRAQDIVIAAEQNRKRTKK
ncbi:M48 family metalloprotease [Epibacterium ulvae]|uniref:M48 family metalloprotease n=1 Tax=Epibacterium ulvae TaxID=1156985 RepID=UPI00249291D5|nr:M48 family metalloprotease [Epibacterium ulvae]